MKTAISKHTTIAAQQVARGDNQIAEICGMFGFSEMQYLNYQYDEYERFLAHVLHGTSVEFYNKVRYSPLMRGFWNNEWIRRVEESFLPMARFHLFEGLEVNSKGEIIEVEPVEDSLECMWNEFWTLHNATLLYNDHLFIDRFDHVLTLISKS